MKIEIEAGELARAMAVARAVVPSRTVVPHTACVMLKTIDGHLRIEATDFTRHIALSVPMVSLGDFNSCVSADSLGSLAKSFSPKSIITLECEGTRATVSAGKSKYKLEALDVEGFPSVGEMTEFVVFSVPRTWLETAIAVPAKFADKPGGRIALQGVTLQRLGDGKLMTFGSDTHRLHRTLLDVPDLPNKDIGFILPETSASVAHSVLPHEDVLVELSASSIRLSAGGVSLRSQLLDCTPMNIESILPSRGDFHFIADAAETKEVLKRMKSVIERGKSSVPVRVAWSCDSLRFAVGPIVDQSSEDITAVVDVEGEMAVNIDYLTQALDCLPGERWGVSAQNVRLSLLSCPGHDGVDHAIMGMSKE